MAKAESVEIQDKVVKQYAIVAKPDLSLLVEEVNHLIGRGWQPVGGVAALQNGTVSYHFQAVVKY
jgi:Domain of unknown function (DUF1737)